jgi:DNA-binding GntR family transcriptional regulator
LAEQAYQALRVRILHGDIAPGTKLKIETLQRAHALSSSPLREALNRLTAEGLVLADDRRGFRAAPISTADLWDITSMRLLLERAALEESMARGTDEWEARIIAAFHRLERVETRIVSGLLALNDDWTGRHKDFHMALLSACASPRLQAQCSSLFDQSERYRRLSARHRKEPRNKAGEHRRLMDLVLARNVKGAVAGLREHVMETATNVARVLGKVEPLAP